MTSKKSRGKATRSGKRGVKDLPVAGARGKNAKGGFRSSLAPIVKSVGPTSQAIAGFAGGGPGATSYSQAEMGEDLE